MKFFKLLSLAAMLATSAASANNAIVFPGSNSAVGDAPIVFPKAKTPVPIVGGYTLENGLLTASTYNCGINLDDLDMEAKVHWEGNTPQLLIVGDYPETMCRAGFTGEFTLDLTQFIHNTPVHILDRLEVVTNPRFR
ncbi:hypothetical protein Q8W40_06695 [Vibrio penaeicida]|uniref:hypothetical protein n=1 Tax=Vibrio penaeicida TaxID=104609 RepID=UPI002736E05C|nr:hypothetical protein [Vibrio penaeicida]MDP2571859.1 hypothetical protein [Vibrio penaeicida]